MPFSVAVAMAMVKLEGLAPPKKYFFKTVIILNYHVKFQVDITNIKEKVSAHRCLALNDILSGLENRYMDNHQLDKSFHSFSTLASPKRFISLVIIDCLIMCLYN